MKEPAFVDPLKYAKFLFPGVKDLLRTTEVQIPDYIFATFTDTNGAQVKVY
jgi:hypothetical protein